MKLVIDNKIPFIKGRPEKAGLETVYASPEEITPRLIADADGLIVRTRTRVDEKLLKESKVKFVATATIGTDHIDLAWCKANGITVANAAGCNAPGVAQYVWSTLLRQGFTPGRDTLGLVGKGNVGRIVAAWGRLMGTRIIVCDPPRKEAGLTDEEYLPLEDVLSQSDAVTLHTPLLHEGEHPTYHLIGPTELSLLKPGSILINSSRGAVVDNRAWTSRLQEGDTRAIIDVWEGEPDISGELLEQATYATPHIAGYSLEGKERATRMALESVSDFFGIEIPTDNLTEAYKIPGSFARTAPDIIRTSYAPEKDDANLRQHPENFEALRSSYNFRPEPVL